MTISETEIDLFKEDLSLFAVSRHSNFRCSPLFFLSRGSWLTAGHISTGYELEELKNNTIKSLSFFKIRQDSGLLIAKLSRTRWTES
jgi:hypothetical protein